MNSSSILLIYNSQQVNGGPEQTRCLSRPWTGFFLSILFIIRSCQEDSRKSFRTASHRQRKQSTLPCPCCDVETRTIIPTLSLPWSATRGSSDQPGRSLFL